MRRPRVMAGALLALSLAVAGCSSDDPPPRPDGIPTGSETDGGSRGGTNDGGANTGSDGTGSGGSTNNPTQSGGGTP